MSERTCDICGTALPARKQKCSRCKRPPTSANERRRANEYARILRKYGLLKEAA